jgi:hypothetical protein
MDDPLRPEPARKANVKRGMFRFWVLFSVLWVVPLIGLSAPTWYRAAYYSLQTRGFQISEYQNPQTKEVGFDIKSRAGCSYYEEDAWQVRQNSKIAFAYIVDYEKQRPCKASPDGPWWSKDMLVENPHGGYNAKQVVWLSPPRARSLRSGD